MENGYNIPWKMKMGLLYIFHCHGYFNCYKATWNIDTMNQMRNVFDIINMKNIWQAVWMEVCHRLSWSCNISAILQRRSCNMLNMLNSNNQNQRMPSKPFKVSNLLILLVLDIPIYTLNHRISSPCHQQPWDPWCLALHLDNLIRHVGHMCPTTDGADRVHETHLSPR